MGYPWSKHESFLETPYFGVFGHFARFSGVKISENGSFWTIFGSKRGQKGVRTPKMVIFDIFEKRPFLMNFGTPQNGTFGSF